MTNIPLITSLPPRMSRKLPDGTEIGAEYQAQCAASWRAAGFTDIISVNSRAELEALPQIYDLAKSFGIRVVAVDRDAKEVAGKAYAYVADMMKVGAQESGGGNFAVINADILLAPGANAHDLVVEKARPGQFLIGRRLPVATPEGAPGEPYYWGFDFFAGHSSDLAGAPDIGLVFGNPWWDYYFPAMLCCAGAKAVHVEEPMIIHLEHEERWTNDSLHRLGADFLNRMSQLTTEPRWKTETAALYGQQLDGVIRNVTGRRFRDFAVSVRRRMPWYSKMEEHYLLIRFATLSVKFIDSYKTTGREAISA